MKFSTREDIRAPIDTVFAAVTDFEHFERQVLRRGAEVSRIDSGGAEGVGMSWRTRVPIRGRTREITSELTEMRPPTGVVLESHSAGVESIFVVDLLALSQTRTRLRVSLDMRPTNFSARLFVQSLKLAKASLSRRFSDRVAGFAADIQNRSA